MKLIPGTSLSQANCVKLCDICENSFSWVISSNISTLLNSFKYKDLSHPNLTQPQLFLNNRRLGNLVKIAQIEWLEIRKNMPRTCKLGVTELLVEMFKTSTAKKIISRQKQPNKQFKD